MRFIGIQHRVKLSANEELRPTRVAILEGDDLRQLELALAAAPEVRAETGAVGGPVEPAGTRPAPGRYAPRGPVPRAAIRAGFRLLGLGI